MVCLLKINLLLQACRAYHAVVGVAKTTTEVNQIVINCNCILQPVKRIGLFMVHAILKYFIVDHTPMYVNVCVCHSVCVWEGGGGEVCANFIILGAIIPYNCERNIDLQMFASMNLILKLLE